jgi:hypothetical protein
MSETGIRDRMTEITLVTIQVYKLINTFLNLVKS